MEAETAGRRLVGALARLGVTHGYTVPGESFLEVLEAARTEAGVELVSCRHESGASFMADADAKLTGVPAFAAATRAPGAANLAIGVHTALHDSTPLIALLGQVPSDLLGCPAAFQGIDLAAFYRPITKWTTTLLDPTDAEAVARQAFRQATTGRPGPVAIVLPTDVLPLPASPVGALAGDREGEPAGEGGPRAGGPRAGGRGARPSDDVLSDLLSRLSSARRPVLVVGGRTAGCAGALVELAERLGIGVYTAFRRQDRFPNHHPAYLGHLTIVTPAPLLSTLEQADVVVVLGARLSETTTQGFRLPGRSAYLAHLDVATEPGGPLRPPDLALDVDVVGTVARLVELARAEPARGVAGLAAAHQAYLEVSTPPAPPRSGPLHPAEVIAAMAATFPEDAIVTSDAGNFSIFLHRYWRYRHPGTQLAPTSGAMGYAVPAAVAAARWRSERLSLAVAGDGGYLMTGQEIETAVRLGVKLVTVVLRNGLYGTIAMHQARSFGALSGVEIGDVDVAAHARSLGATGFTVTGRGELAAALREAMGAPGPAVVDVPVDPDALSPETRLSGLLR